MRNSPIILVPALALALSACSGGKETPEAPADAETSAAEEVTETAPATETPAAVEAPAAEATPTPTPTATPTPEAKKAEAPAPAPKADPVEVASAAPPASFARCAVCHTADKGGPNKLGPNLFGTYGKSAGVHAGFNYSPALKDSGIVWNDENLHAWLENPRALVPGNRMSFPGLKDAAKRQEIIDYLKQQH